VTFLFDQPAEELRYVDQKRMGQLYHGAGRLGCHPGGLQGAP
jgi:hypothetical protein